MLGWIYDVTVCPGWKVGRSTDVNALSDPTIAVPEGSVKMLTTSDTNSEGHHEEQAGQVGFDFTGCGSCHLIMPREE